MRGRTSEIQFNFDSLTDAVTNLNGTLILIVVLVLGVTQDIKPKAAPPPPSPPTSQAGGKPIAPLLRQIELLKLQIRTVDERIQDMESLVPEFQRQVDDLRKKRATPGTNNAPAPAPPPVRGRTVGIPCDTSPRSLAAFGAVPRDNVQGAQL